MDRLRVILAGTTERADSAEARVLIGVFESAGLFGSSEYKVEDMFDTARAGTPR